GAPGAAPELSTIATVFESVRWHPRRWRDRDDRDGWQSQSHNGPTGFSQIHAGFHQPDGQSNTGFLAGARGGLGADEHIQMGAGLDWIHRQERVSELVSSAPLPGGGTS